MKYNELINGMIITVSSATNDYGRTNDPNGWRMPFFSPFDKKVNGITGNLSYSVLKKIVKTGCYEVIAGGFGEGVCKGAITKIRILK